LGKYARKKTQCVHKKQIQLLAVLWTKSSIVKRPQLQVKRATH